MSHEDHPLQAFIHCRASKPLDVGVQFRRHRRPADDLVPLPPISRRNCSEYVVSRSTLRDACAQRNALCAPNRRRRRSKVGGQPRVTNSANPPPISRATFDASAAPVYWYLGSTFALIAPAASLKTDGPSALNRSRRTRSVRERRSPVASLQSR